jgi:hypothetical protein
MQRCHLYRDIVTDSFSLILNDEGQALVVGIIGNGESVSDLGCNSNNNDAYVYKFKGGNISAEGKHKFILPKRARHLYFRNSLRSYSKINFRILLETETLVFCTECSEDLISNILSCLRLSKSAPNGILRLFGVTVPGAQT